MSSATVLPISGRAAAAPQVPADSDVVVPFGWWDRLYRAWLRDEPERMPERSE